MALNKIGQTWPLASKNSFLASQISRQSDFPDPVSLFSLYAAIVKEEPLNAMPEPFFAPFKGRFRERELLERYGYGMGGRRDHAFWISTLASFLKSQPLVQYISDQHQCVELTPFGTYLFPHVMQAFEDLYHQNDRLKKAVAEYRAPQE